MISIAIGIVLLYIGAESLVRGSSRLAAHFGIRPLIIGLTIVAFGTSAPELTVSLAAALKGSSDVAVGNVVGSNIFNVAVILGITALIRPPSVHIDLVKREIPIMILVVLLGFGLVCLGHVSRLAGIALFLGLCAYIFFTIRAARNQPDENPSGLSTEQSPVWMCSLMIVAGLGILVWGSDMFVEGSVALARKFGVSEAVIGLTIVAAGTSLPELATSVVAAIKKEADVAIGNIVGSNMFNILCILGLTAAIQPIQVGGIGMRDAAFMLGVSILLLPFALTQKSLSRAEGCVFLSIYGVYLYLLWPTQPV